MDLFLKCGFKIQCIAAELRGSFAFIMTVRQQTYFQSKRGINMKIVELYYTVEILIQIGTLLSSWHSVWSVFYVIQS